MNRRSLSPSAVNGEVEITVRVSTYEQPIA